MICASFVSGPTLVARTHGDPLRLKLAPTGVSSPPALRAAGHPHQRPRSARIHQADRYRRARQDRNGHHRLDDAARWRQRQGQVCLLSLNLNAEMGPSRYTAAETVTHAAPAASVASVNSVHRHRGRASR